MSYLLDTNVLSESTRRRPHAGVRRWLAARRPEELHVSELSLAEILKGILLLPEGGRRTRLRTWLDDELRPSFGPRVLPLGAIELSEWARLQAAAQQAGRPLSTTDSLIAATALAHRLSVVTRNTDDFRGAGVRCVDPWK